MVTLNAWMNMYNGFERPNYKKKMMVAPNTWMSMHNGTMALNAKTKKDGDSKCMNGYEKWLWMLKLKKNGDTECRTEQWLWMPKWRRDFERQTEEYDASEYQ